MDPWTGQEQALDCGSGGNPGDDGADGPTIEYMYPAAGQTPAAGDPPLCWPYQVLAAST